MKTILLISALVLTGAPASWSEHRPRIVNSPPQNPGYNSLAWTVRNVQRTTAAQLAEQALIRDFSTCLQLTFCIVGTNPQAQGYATHHQLSQDNHVLTMAAGVVASVETFKQVLTTVEHSQPMTRMQQLVSSYELGRATRDAHICQSTFPCDHPASDLKIRPIGKALGGNNLKLSHLIDCKALSSVCPGVSIGCSLCAMFAPATCSSTCTVGALFCGSTAIGCMEAKRRKEAKTTTTPPTTTVGTV